MYKKIVLITGVILLVFPGVSQALRCGNTLAVTGDLKHAILLACGKPVSREVIGYIDREKVGDRIKVMIIEEWIINSSGEYYSLVFEGNRLVTIESAGRKK